MMACDDRGGNLNSLPTVEPVLTSSHSTTVHCSHSNSITEQETGSLGTLYDIPLCIIQADPLTESLDVAQVVEHAEAADVEAESENSLGLQIIDDVGSEDELKLNHASSSAGGVSVHTEPHTLPSKLGTRASGSPLNITTITDAGRKRKNMKGEQDSAGHKGSNVAPVVSKKDFFKTAYTPRRSAAKDSRLRLSKDSITVANRNVWVVRPTDMLSVTKLESRTCSIPSAESPAAEINVPKNAACPAAESHHQGLQLSDPVPDVIAAETVVMTTPGQARHPSATSLHSSHNLLLAENANITGPVLPTNQSDFLESGATVPGAEEDLLAFASLTSSTDSSVREQSKKERDRMKKREQRQDPDYREREKVKTRERMRLARSNPTYRELERSKDRQRRQLARQNNQVQRQSERDRDRALKQKRRLQSAQERAETQDSLDMLLKQGIMYCEVNGGTL